MLDLISLLSPNQPLERCGLIIDDEIVEITNIHEKPDNGFRMDPAEMLDTIERASATWHTHPVSDPILSESDYEGFCQWPNLVHHIVGVRDGEPTVETYKVTDGLVIKL